MSGTAKTTDRPGGRELAKAYDPRSRARSTSAGWPPTSSRRTARARPADPALPPFTIIQPPPNVTGALHLGHAQRTAVEDLMIRHARMQRPPDALPARPRPRRASPPSSCSTGSSPTKARARESLGRERYLERMRRVHRRDPRGDARPAASPRRSLDWGRLRFTMDEGSAQGGARRLRPALPRRPGLSGRGARQLVPRLPDERQRPRGDRDARDRDALVGALPPHRRGDRRARSGARRSPSRPLVRRRSSATPRSPSIPTTSATPRSWAERCGSRSPIATCRSSPTTWSIRPSGRAVKITPAHDHDDFETGLRHGLPMITVLADDATSRHRHAYDGLDATRRARGSSRTSRPGDLVGPSPHEMVIGRCERATTSSSHASRPSGSSDSADGRAALDATRSGRTRFLPERFGRPCRTG